MTVVPPDRPRGRFVRWLGVTARTRRRLGKAARLVAALALVGGIYTAFAPGIEAQETGDLSAAAQAGRELYENSCVTCHGENAQGVPDRGPSLIGVGAAAVEFQVTSGRMPMARQEAQAERKPPMFTDEEARQIAAYIQELGGGPVIPEGDLAAGGDLAEGGQLFRLNCAQCHQYAGSGGALSSGAYAPDLYEATQRQIYGAMLSGPQNMPVFSDSQLSPQDKADIIAYIQFMQNEQDPGGWGIGRLGPSTEALVIFLVGMVSLVFATLWIAGKS